MPTSRDAALATLARERGDALTRYAYLLTGDVPAAQDLVQDALVKVFVRIRGGFEPDVLEAYVRRSIVTLYVDGYRKRRTWANVRHLFADGDVAPAGPDTATTVDVARSLATLGRQERTAVVLRYFEDLTVPEIADRMGLAEGSVKRYLSNAVRRLEERLGPLPSARTTLEPVEPTAERRR